MCKPTQEPCLHVPSVDCCVCLLAQQTSGSDGKFVLAEALPSVAIKCLRVILIHVPRVRASAIDSVYTNTDTLPSFESKNITRTFHLPAVENEENTGAKWKKNKKNKHKYFSGLGKQQQVGFLPLNPKQSTLVFSIEANKKKKLCVLNIRLCFCFDIYCQQRTPASTSARIAVGFNKGWHAKMMWNVCGNVLFCVNFWEVLMLDAAG